MNIAVIFAGGIGSRMKMPGMPKQFLKIDDIPIIVHTIMHFEKHPQIDKIVIVMLENYINYMKELVIKHHLTKVSHIVAGGKTGQESIYHGLLTAKKISKSEKDIVLIHDGVRPIIENDLISKNIESVKEFGSSISAVPSKETIVQISPNNYISHVIDRSTAWLARAPQSFYLKDILSSHEKARKEGKYDIIDSCTMMMQYNFNCHMVETCSENIKVTTPDDFYIVERIMHLKKE